MYCIQMKNDFYSINTLKTYLTLRNGVGAVSPLLKESEPYWDALKNDDTKAWSLLPFKERLWLISDSGVLVEDTKWTAAAKCSSKKCLRDWVPDNNLNKGQKIWGDTHFFGSPKHGGGNLLHSVQHLTDIPEVAFKLNDLLFGVVIFILFFLFSSYF